MAWLYLQPESVGFNPFKAEVAAFLLAMKDGYIYENFEWFAARFTTFLHVDRIVVGSAYQGLKPGTLTYNDMFNYAKSNDIAIIACEYNMVPPNGPSRIFHGKVGFREVGSGLVAAQGESRFQWQRPDSSSGTRFAGPLDSDAGFHGDIMLKLATAIVMLCLVPSISAAASVGENQADSFVHLYSSLCLKHVNNLEALRAKLTAVPKLPPEKAAHFLVGRAGDAWPVPDKYGTYVLVLLTGKNFCGVYARRADTEAVERQFVHLVATAPAPLVARQVTNEHADISANGQTHTVSYEWSEPDARRKMLFTLTTAPSASAQIQALGSAAIVGQ